MGKKKFFIRKRDILVLADNLKGNTYSNPLLISI